MDSGTQTFRGTVEEANIFLSQWVCEKNFLPLLKRSESLSNMTPTLIQEASEYFKRHFNFRKIQEKFLLPGVHKEHIVLSYDKVCEEASLYKLAIISVLTVLSDGKDVSLRTVSRVSETRSFFSPAINLVDRIPHSQLSVSSLSREESLEIFRFPIRALALVPFEESQIKDRGGIKFLEDVLEKNPSFPLTGRSRFSTLLSSFPELDNASVLVSPANRIFCLLTGSLPYRRKISPDDKMAFLGTRLGFVSLAGTRNAIQKALLQEDYRKLLSMAQIPTRFRECSPDSPATIALLIQRGLATPSPITGIDR